jgi:hypothetical protein
MIRTEPGRGGFMTTPQDREVAVFRGIGNTILMRQPYSLSAGRFDTCQIKGRFTHTRATQHA